MLNTLFSNIGKKIQLLAKILFVAGIALSLIIGIVLMCDGIESYIWIGIAILIFGPAISLISSWFLHGYGEIIHNTADIASCSRKIAEKQNQDSSSEKNDTDRLEKLKKLLADGLITEEEYRTALSK